MRDHRRKQHSIVKIDRRMIRECQRDPMISLRKIVEAPDVKVSTKTIRRRLKQIGLRCCKAASKAVNNKDK